VLSAYTSQVPCSSFLNYAIGDCALLYEIVSTYDWSLVYSQAPADSAIELLSSVVTEARSQANLGTKCKKLKVSVVWSCSTCKYYIRKKLSFVLIKKTIAVVIALSFHSVLNQLH
jgi:hypothetical protein